MRGGVILPQLAGFVATATLALSAQGQAALPAAVLPSAQVVKQKEALVKRMLTDSPAATRIARSNHDEAKKLFAAAQQNYDRSLASIQSGDIGAAERELNEAMWNLGKARQMVPDIANRAIEDRVRYQRLVEATEGLRAAYGRHLARAKGQPAGSAGTDADLTQATQLIEEAKNLANSEQTGESVKLLERAEKTLMVALNRLLGARTLEYAAQFETLAEEFAYELDRNRSYVDLVPVALNELKPAEDARRLVERYVERNRGLVEEAQRHAAGKDYKSALKDVRSGTGFLQRALLAAGLVLPQEAAEKTE
jgi:hypothetical protein